nr:MAG TPA: tail protein [Caudoviricetes sp.]
MAVLLARGQITIVAIKDGKDGAQGKDYWQQDVWVDLSAAEYDRNVWYPVVGGALPSGGFVGIKVSVGLNSGTKPSWSTHSAGFSVDFHIDTQRSGWGETPGETIIYTDNYAWCPVSPVSYRQLSNDSRPVLYLRGGGKYRVIATIAIEWKIYKDGYTWQSGQYSQSAMPQNSRPTPEGHTLKGDKGDKGNPGKDSITWTLTPDTITYDTDDSGKAINVGTGKTTTLRVLRGNDELTNFTIKGVKNMVNCLASRLNNTNSFYISTITAQKVTLGTDTINVSCTNGSFDVEFDIDGITYTATAKFAVNVAAFTGIVAFDNKSYKSQFEEVSDRLNSTATKDELTLAKSEIKQTAREISLSVSEKSIARRNLLVGSDFRKQTNDFIISNDARIEMNSGYQGTNCIKVIDDTDGKPHYLGVYWDGSQGGKSIKIEKGKKYTISCWYFTNYTNAIFCLEAIYTDKQTNGKRLGQVTYEASNYFSPKYDQWQLFTTVINTKDAKSDYIAFNFWEFCNINAGRIVAYISRPMVEAGAEYNGWTLSDKDYDYVGANLIDNSRTFELGGNVIRVVGTKKLVGDAYELSATLGDDYNTFYEIDNTAFKLNTDYTISFEVKGDAKYMGVFVYYKPTNTPWAYYKEQQDNPLYEANGDGKTDGYGVLLEVKDLSDKQQKVWSHFKFKERLPESIYLQFPKNSEQTGVTSWNVTITKPKIEVGAVVTEYTERKSDLVDKASLKKAGIEVKSDEVLLYGDRIRVNNNGQTAAMFIGGKLNADFIDADKIEVKHLWAKSEDGATKVGYFGNYEIDACKVNDTYAPLFVGADTADKALFYVSKDGYMNAKAGKIGSFLISPTGYANSIIAGTWKDATNIDINKFGTRLELSDTKLEFLYGSGSAISGDVVYSSTNAQIAIDPSKARHGFTSCGLDIRVDVFAATACGIHLDVSGFLGDPAIYIKKGTVWGFRPHIVSVGSDYHLRDDDTIVMCTNWNNDITLTLPDDPQHGQYYVVIHRGRNIIFKSNADKIMTKNNPSGVSSFGDSTFYQINWIFYDGEQWILIYKT